MKKDELAKFLEELASKSDEELSDLESSLLDNVETLSGDPTDENLDEMEVLAEAIMSIREQVATRESDKADRQGKVTSILDKVKPVEVEAPAETPEVEVEAEVEVEVEAPAEEAPVEAEKELVTASAQDTTPQPTLEQLNDTVPAEMKPRARNSRVVITAGADVPGFSAGSTIEDWDRLGDALVKKARSLRGVRNINAGARYPVLSIEAQYPEGRQLIEKETELNSSRVSDVTSPYALTASGGLCAPVEAHYGLENISQASRPLRDSLPKFQASRGGIRFITPPQLVDVAGAIDVTTEAADAAGGAGAEKSILTISCGDEVEVTISAVSLRLEVGQFSRMTFPEQFRAWYDLALSNHARRAEQAILDGVSANSTAVTTDGVVGAARDLLNDYGRLAAQYRNRHRMKPDSQLVVWLPEWIIDVFQADYAMQLPGDGLEAYLITRDWVVKAFGARKMAVTFYQDERTGAGQIFAAQGAGASLGWITPVEGYMFHPGAHLFLDGGTLDLGVEIRDTTTIETNDLQAFMETFENVAFTGIESLRIRSTICVSGRSAGTVDISCPGVGS